ncbi:MAG: NF038122 family metalloprotease [Leptolyngbyaceae bacterium]|nr:NF038122 family metalloprotease [Leptolyngbyaceae bacterium]
MIHSPRLSLLICPAIALLIALNPFDRAFRAQAIQFNFDFPEDTPPEVIKGFEDAGQIWSSVVLDDITVDLTIDYQPFNTTSLGRFVPENTNVEYRDLLAALQTDRTSLNDAIAFDSLQGSNELTNSPFSLIDFDLLINGTLDNPNGVGSSVPYVDNDGGCNNRSVRITTANAKALGLPTLGTGICNARLTPPPNDGSIIINSSFDWDFDVSDGIDPFAYDFVGVALQGLGATLGNTSGIRVLDFNSPFIDGDEELFFDDDQFPFVSLPDLYRFSPEGAALGIIDWTTGRTTLTGSEVRKYFSIDGGQTPLANFSTGLIKGDGNRPSSWQADEIGGETLGLFEPTPNAEQILQFSTTDQILFDVIGYTLANSADNPPVRGITDPPNPPERIPEPSSAIALFPIAWFGFKWLRQQR